MPLAAGPGGGEVRERAGRKGRGEAARRVPLKLFGGYAGRRHQARARRLGEDADGVVVVGRGAEAPVPPGVVERVGGDAAQARGLLVRRDLVADESDLAQQQRGDVRVRRVVEGRDEEARAGLPLLVYVVDDFGEPLLPEEAREGARLREVEHEPVAVVVVAGVGVVNLRRLGALPGLAHRGAIPVGDDLYAVGVGRGDEDEDRVVQNLARVGVLRGRQLVGELRGHLRGDDLRGVNRAGDDDDGLAFADKSLALGVPVDEARVGEAALDVAIFVEFAYILRRAQVGDEERPAERALADLPDEHAVARAVEPLEVVCDLSPVGDAPVFAGREAEHVAGRGRSDAGCFAFSPSPRSTAPIALCRGWRWAGRCTGCGWCFWSSPGAPR